MKMFFLLLAVLASMSLAHEQLQEEMLLEHEPSDSLFKVVFVCVVVLLLFSFGVFNHVPFDFLLFFCFFFFVFFFPFLTILPCFCFFFVQGCDEEVPEHLLKPIRVLEPSRSAQDDLVQRILLEGRSLEGDLFPLFFLLVLLSVFCFVLFKKSFSFFIFFSL